MSDYEKLKSVFKDIGIEFSEYTSEKAHGETPHTADYDGEITFDKFIRVEHGIGYFGFECDFYFLKNKYEGHGVWE